MGDDSCTDPGVDPSTDVGIDQILGQGADSDYASAQPDSNQKYDVDSNIHISPQVN